MRAEEFGEVRDHDVFEAACHCEAIEEYQDDTPYPSALVLGFTSRGRPLHLVCAHDASSDLIIVITVYHPDPARWDNHRRRK